MNREQQRTRWSGIDVTWKHSWTPLEVGDGVGRIGLDDGCRRRVEVVGLFEMRMMVLRIVRAWDSGCWVECWTAGGDGAEELSCVASTQRNSDGLLSARTFCRLLIQPSGYWIVLTCVTPAGSHFMNNSRASFFHALKP